MLKNHIFTIAFIGWMVFITLLSFFSFSGIDSSGIGIPNINKWVHFTFYFVASLLGCLFIREKTHGTRGLGNTIAIVFGFCVIYGIIIEVFQKYFTTHREGEIMDALANSVGALAGVFLIKILFSGKSQLKWKI